MASNDIIIKDDFYNPLDLSVPPEKMEPNKLPDDLGQTAIHVLSGMLNDTRDPNKLTSTIHTKINTYKKMQADPTIGGALQGYENILSLVKWKVVPTSAEVLGVAEEEFDEDLAKEYRNFVQSCFNDEGTSIESIVESALDMLAIGFQITVPEFKIRMGYNDTPKLNSKFDDGKIGWKCWKTIRQESVDRWLVPDGEGYSSLNGVRQRRVNGGYTTIPRNRMLLFRTTSKGDNMEGLSILYSAVSTWVTLQKVLDIEVVSLARNLEGIPVLKIASKYLSDAATSEEQKLRDILIKQVKSVKYNEQVALVLPSDVDPESKVPIIDIQLLTAGPNVRVDQCRTTAAAKEQLIAESILANFMKLGQGGGSYAMSSSLQDMFVLAMKKYLESISNVINKEAIPTLLRVNGMDPKYAPRIEHKGLDTESLASFIDALVKMVQSGVVIPTKELQKEVLEKMNLDTSKADSAFEEVEELQAKLLEASQAGDIGQDQGTPEAPTEEAVEKSVKLFKHKGNVYVFDQETYDLKRVNADIEV